MTLGELAKQARLSPKYLTRLEAGTRANPSLAVLACLATALQVTVGNLVGAELEDGSETRHP